VIISFSSTLLHGISLVDDENRWGPPVSIWMWWWRDKFLMFLSWTEHW